MYFLRTKLLLVITVIIPLFFAVPGSVHPGNISITSDQVLAQILTFPSERIESNGYMEVAEYDDGFVAVGSGGRIDRISETGKIIRSEEFTGENFNSLICDNKMIMVAGDNGVLRISRDGGIFRKAESGTERDINSITVFNRTIIAGADDGVIISGDPRGSFNEIYLNLKGNIVSVSSRITDCYGVTDEGEIIHSTDGIHWDILDFNKVYSGFYKQCYFTKVLVTENRIAVTGVNKDNTPLVMFSSQGGVWTERSLDYKNDQGINVSLEDLPNNIIYDETGNDFFLVCNKGKLMKLPSCNQCNELEVISSEDLEGISLNGNTMMIVGGNFLIRSINIR